MRTLAQFNPSVSVDTHEDHTRISSTKSDASLNLDDSCVVLRRHVLVLLLTAVVYSSLPRVVCKCLPKPNQTPVFLWICKSFFVRMLVNLS